MQEVAGKMLTGKCSQQGEGDSGKRGAAAGREG